MPLYPLIAFRKAEATCKSLEETAKDTPAFFEALKTKEAARKALEKAAKEREVALKTLKEVQKNRTELAIAANKAQGATQKARKAEQAASTAATEANAAKTAAGKGKAVVQTEQAASTAAPEANAAKTAAGKGEAVVQTEQAANEMESGVQATQATTQQAGAIKGANQPLKPLTHVSQNQAKEVANAVGGRVIGSATNKKGYRIAIGHPEHPKVKIRLMNPGSGQREQAYMKISKRHRAIDKNGNWEHNPALIHIDLYEGDLVAQVQEVLDKNEKMLELIK